MPVNSTARKIAAAAGRLLHREGADAVTLRRVASAVGITPMAVYRHYAGRDGLLNTLADAGFDDLASRLAAVPSTGAIERRIDQFVGIYLDHSLQNPRLFELMFLKPREGARVFPRDFKAGRSPTATPSAKLIQQGIDSGYFRDNDPWEISFEMGALLQGLIMLYLGGRVGLSPVRFRALCHRSVWRYLNGIRT